MRMLYTGIFCEIPPSEEQKPTEQLPVEQQPTEKLPEEQQPAEQLPEEQQPAEQLPEEQQPAEQLPEEQQPAEQLPEEQKRSGLPMRLQKLLRALSDIENKKRVKQNHNTNIDFNEIQHLKEVHDSRVKQNKRKAQLDDYELELEQILLR